MPDLMGALRAFPEPGETPPRTHEVAVARMGDLVPGDVVVERYLGPGDAPEVVVRREIPLPLPTLPGYYLADAPEPGGPAVVELLNRPDRQWVDAGDRTYLSEDQVRALLPLHRLHRVDDLIAEVEQIEINDPTGAARRDFREGLVKIARMHGVTL